MATESSYTIAPLSPETWPAFDALVQRHNGIFGGCWCIWFHPDGPERGQGAEANRALKCSYVEQGKAHAALVMDGDDAVAWAEYGTPAELPNLHHRKEYDATKTVDPDYRITCVFVDKRHRRRGVTELAITGALELIAQAGGGRVESLIDHGPRPATGPSSRRGGSAATVTTPAAATGCGHDVRRGGVPVSAGRPSGQLLALSTDECFDLLATQQVGRVVFSDDHGPVALPVNFVVQDRTVLVRTEPGNTLARHLSESATCAFEVDEIDPALHSGWSVLVRGSASLVRHLSPAPHARWPGPWAPGERHLLLRISPDELSGRRLVP